MGCSSRSMSYENRRQPPTTTTTKIQGARIGGERGRQGGGEKGRGGEVGGQWNLEERSEERHSQTGRRWNEDVWADNKRTRTTAGTRQGAPVKRLPPKRSARGRADGQGAGRERDGEDSGRGRLAGGRHARRGQGRGGGGRGAADPPRPRGLREGERLRVHAGEVPVGGGRRGGSRETTTSNAPAAREPTKATWCDSISW